LNWGGLTFLLRGPTEVSPWDHLSELSGTSPLLLSE
jgi:hypothetical protein